MKHLSRISLLTPFAILFLFQLSMTSCTKEIIHDTIIKHDTLTIIKIDTILTSQLLASHPWKIQEDRGVVGPSIIYYLRGGTNNTQSFDNEYIVFREDKTGTHSENNGIQRSFTWDFANLEHTKLTWTLYNTPATFTITWDNIRYKNGNLSFDQYYVDGNTGNNSHSQEVRIPK